MKNVVIINGCGGSGKDTFINLCSEKRNVHNISSITPAKDALQCLVGVDAYELSSKDETIRSLLHTLKNLSVEYNDYPFQYITKEIRKFVKTDDDILFIHIRESSEIDKVVNWFNGNKFKDCIICTLLITRDDQPSILSNIADANVSAYHYDYSIVNNNNIDDYRTLAMNFINITEMECAKYGRCMS